jgi:16S rRNA (cytosine967-C5)-methyltransferase
MRPDALLEVTAELLRRVLKFEHPADRVVASFFREHSRLGARERHGLAETVFEVLRSRLLYVHLARQGQGSLERRLAILAWRGDAGYLRAALSQPEAEWLMQADAIDRSGLPEPLRHNLPDWLVGLLRPSRGDSFGSLAESLMRPAPLDLRVNLLKAKRDQALEALERENVEVQPTPLSPIGLRVTGKPSLAHVEAVEQGLVEVQDEGSQLLTLLVEARRGEMVVDFCAGAGGKTLALGAAMRNTGRLYALDTSGHRLAALQPRLARSGLSNVHTLQLAHERDDRLARLRGKVDRVLVDAPCSGLGTLRRHPDLKWRLTPQAIADYAGLQQAILASAASLLKPGGRLVYATCSLLEAENESVVRAFEAAGEGFRRVPALEILERIHVPQAATLVEGDNFRLWPDRHETDGFFASIWQRP